MGANYNRRRGRNPARGAALLWAIVFIAIVTAVAAAVAPFAMQANDLNDVAQTATILRNIALAVDTFNNVVTRGGATNHQNPLLLTQLTNAIVTNDSASCTVGATRVYSGNSVSTWAAHGPFGPYVMQTAGTFTPLGTVENRISNSSTVQGRRRTATSDPYFIQITGVNVQLARLLDSYVDHAPNASADTVWYSAVAPDSTVMVSYRVFMPFTPTC